MTLENMIRAIAGTFVVISLALGYLVSPYWHLFTAFVGLNLLQSSFTHWCLMEKILIKAGVAKPTIFIDTREPALRSGNGGLIPPHRDSVTRHHPPAA